jgi:hypothetical protein
MKYFFKNLSQTLVYFTKILYVFCNLNPDFVYSSQLSGIIDCDIKI